MSIIIELNMIISLLDNSSEFVGRRLGGGGLGFEGTHSSCHLKWSLCCVIPLDPEDVSLPLISSVLVREIAL